MIFEWKQSNQDPRFHWAVGKWGFIELSHWLWVWWHWVSPLWDDPAACSSGSVSAPWQIPWGWSASPSCDVVTSPGCCHPVWAHWWSPAAGWSSTLSRSQSARCGPAFASTAAAELLKLRQRRGKHTDLKKKEQSLHSEMLLNASESKIITSHHKFLIKSTKQIVRGKKVNKL